MGKKDEDIVRSKEDIINYVKKKFQTRYPKSNYYDNLTWEDLEKMGVKEPKSIPCVIHAMGKNIDGGICGDSYQVNVTYVTKEDMEKMKRNLEKMINLL